MPQLLQKPRIVNHPDVNANSPTIRCIALYAHPLKGNTVIDAVLPLDGQRCRPKLESLMDSEWTLIDWHTTGDEF